MLPLLGNACFAQRATLRAAVAEESLQDQSVKPAGEARAEIAGLRNRVHVKTCIVCAVCMSAGMWVCGNISVESKRYSCVSKVLCVHKVKVL